MRLDEYTQYDGLGLADLVNRREVSLKELGSIALAAAAKVNPRLNAIIETFSQRLDKASRVDLSRGPFGGVPFLVKDLGLFEKGVRCESGSAIARNFTPNHDSDLTIRFRRAGLVTLGRTTTPEFGSSASTESALTGITRNPWDPARSAGGSSGGSAAAIASGVVPLAHGSLHLSQAIGYYLS